MLKRVYITRCISCFLLVAFAISITPKRFLHDLFAKHIDNRPVKDSHQPTQLTNAGYNCDNDNLVAGSSFVSVQHIFFLPVFTSFSSYLTKDISYASLPGIYSSLRGPPVNI